MQISIKKILVFEANKSSVGLTEYFQNSNPQEKESSNMSIRDELEHVHHQLSVQKALVGNKGWPVTQMQEYEDSRPY